MTIREYNKQFFPKVNKAYCFISNLEHAAQKTDNYEETMKQLRCIGWDDECRETIVQALECYKKSIAEKLN
ncbi:hypothetical protein [Lacrimispora amygdalina]|uniref:hypothetical protein n=1 Tax=Lacrimispora amygdalina TaxID=253257 RepID=UPI000BE2A873|nr:hypothetical protein [Lacrimispora amygdalina]